MAKARRPSLSVQIDLVVKSLSKGVVPLIRDLNGNHVIQRCLQRLGPGLSQFVYDAACANTMDIATHRHGCCVLQRCIDYSTPAQKRDLVEEIAKNALVLSQVLSCQFVQTDRLSSGSTSWFSITDLHSCFVWKVSQWPVAVATVYLCRKGQEVRLRAA
jgi:hypothetical protein